MTLCNYNGKKNKKNFRISNNAYRTIYFDLI